MTIAIGADHVGFSLKQRLRDILGRKGYQVADFGTGSAEPVDYPDYAAQVAQAVLNGEAERGILVCSTGVGMSIAANKTPGIRAGLGVKPEQVRLIRAHNDANILTLGSKFTDEAMAGALVEVFLGTEFDGGRHSDRVAKITALEQRCLGSKELKNVPQ